MLVWDENGKRYYETGCDKGVLYVCDDTGNYGDGVAWNGLTGVTESPSGAESTKLYANNSEYATLMSPETFGGTIKGYTYPDEFGECDGSIEPVAGVQLTQQKRKKFGLSYRNKIGSDTTEYAGYKIHLIYGALVKPSEKDRTTVNDSPEGTEFSWEFDTTPAKVTKEIDGVVPKPTAHIVIDTRTVDKAKLTELEKMLYGGDTDGKAKLPTPDEVINLFKTV